MSAFNVLVADCNCPICRQDVPFEIQFKYGNTWQHTYSIGDKIKWGGNDYGEPGHRKVIVEGIGGPCRECGADNIEFDMILECDSIAEIKPIGIDRPTSNEKGYIVLDG